MSNNQPYKIVFTGPESSGKTSMAKMAATHYGTHWLPEYSRTFLEASDGKYQVSDLVRIAEGQWQAEQDFLSQHAQKSILFFDTSLLVIKVWSQYKYGFYNFKIEQLLRRSLPDYYFLCDWHIPWEPDPLRENPIDRDALYQMYYQELMALKIPFSEIQGTSENRLQQVREVLEKLGID